MSTAEYIEADSREIALRPQPSATPTLFGTDDPVGVVERMSKVADALSDIINKKSLYANVSGKKFVTVEGWTTVGSLVGVFPVLRWTRPVEVDGKSGWEARVEAVTLSGAIVGAAEAMCLKGESTKWHKSANDNAVRSMAQTRATSKALRGPLDFLVKMAGYAATPAEEMEDLTPASGGKPTRATAAQPKEASSPASAAAPTPSPEAEASRDDLYQEAIDLGVTLALKENPQDPDPKATALARLDSACLTKFGERLDKLNSTSLKKVVHSYRLKVEADV